MELPTKAYHNYVGIDPGFTGGIGRINRMGTLVKAYDMPITGKGKKREYDLPGVLKLFQTLAFLPDCVVGLEWPEVQPRWGSAQCEKLGRGKGILEALLVAVDLPYFRIFPNAWKTMLDLPGKTDQDWETLCVEHLEERYPQHVEVLYGPQGGLKDGRLDALLIADLLRDFAEQADF